MTSPERLVVLEDMKHEFYHENTTDERKVELLTTMRGFAEEEHCVRCSSCKQAHVYAPHDSALIEGHTYSRDGLAEIRITNLCEFCFDKITEVFDEDEA